MAQEFERGPYLSAAFLCEKVLIEQDSVKSAIRIIDRVTHTVAGPSPPETMEPFNYETTLFVRFKSGWARGPFQFQINLKKPSGEQPPPLLQTIHFEGEEDRGVDFVAEMRLRVEMPGIYWFEVYLNDRLLTRVPLRVIYTPQPTRQIPPAGGGPSHGQGSPPES